MGKGYNRCEVVLLPVSFYGRIFLLPVPMVNKVGSKWKHLHWGRFRTPVTFFVLAVCVSPFEGFTRSTQIIKTVKYSPPLYAKQKQKITKNPGS